VKLFIVGASGGTGREIVEQALERGHEVTAFARTPGKIKTRHRRLSVAQGDVLDPPSIERAIAGHDAVLCALGHKRFFIKTSILSRGTANIIAAMKGHGIKRFVCETALGIGDTRGRMGLYYTLFVIPVILWFYFRDKEKQEHLIRESPLDWVIVRPAQLTNGKRRGTYRHGSAIGGWILTAMISRADVADFMLNQLDSDLYLRKTPGLAY
jgi:putative NADH-flavin reductase